MRFITLEHEGNTALAYKWLNTCDAGCCESQGIEMRMIFAGDYVTMFIEADSEKDIDKLIENSEEEYIGVLNEVFVRWIAHLTAQPANQPSGLESNEDTDCTSIDVFLPFTNTRLH